MPDVISIVPDRLAHYRIPVFENLSKNSFGLKIRVYADLSEDSSKINKPSLDEAVQFSFHYKSSKDLRVKGRLLLSTGSIAAAFDDSKVVVFWGDAFCPGNWLAACMTRLMGKKLVFWTHGLYGNESWMKKRVRCLFYSLADALLLYGNRSKSLLVQAGVSEDRLFVINNALEFSEQDSVYNNYLSRFEATCESEIKLIFVGRLTAVKRLDLLLKAVANLASCFDVQLKIVGDGDEWDYLTQLVGRLGISDIVTFYGAIYEEVTLAELIIASDITVSPGNVGLTAIHSLIYGTPVITHSNAENQMPEHEAICPGYTGELFDENNVSSLEAAILRCKSNILSGSISAESCRSIIKNSYSLEYQSKVFEELLKKSLGVA
ncbi:glycosyltransferase [Marinobacterium sp. YM272]|uniref:glycosyltransferase n=1 Tax=Marinobacterium sp. YM272 TaxID=3421654 RepID=UPI003D7F6986